MARLKSWGPLAAIVILAFASIPLLIGPKCPQHVVIATGSEDGAYFAFANRYREILARDGITLEVRSTAGSIENLSLLESDASTEVTLGIVQGGTAPAETENGPESLASLYLEPIWVFTRGNQPIERLTELKGNRIAIGAAGSGTRAVALQLLNENDIDSGNLSETTTLLPLGGRQAAAELKQGNIDAAFFVISPQSPLVRELMEAENVHLMNFRRASAYQRKYPFLSSVTLSEGILDLQKNLPSEDIVLLAPSANLVARNGLHSALVPLLLKAAYEVHESGGLLEEPGAFPSLRHIDFAANDDARRYFKSGPSLLFRFLPFWAAAWFDQMKMVLLPLCTLLLPFVKLAPPIYRWSIRSKIYRWYGVLRKIDRKIAKCDDTTNFSTDIETLAKLEIELAEISVPLSYMEEFYNLRLHASYVLGRLQKLQQPRTKKHKEAA